MNVKEAEAVLPEANKTLHQWEELHELLRTSVDEEHEIRPDEEQMFLELKSSISRSMKAMAQAIPGDLTFNSKKAGGILKNTVSLNQVRILPDADKPAIFEDWHEVWIGLVHMQGGLEFIQEGWKPIPKKTGGPPSIQSIKSKGKKKKKGKKKLIIGLIVVAAAVAGALFHFQVI